MRCLCSQVLLYLCRCTGNWFDSEINPFFGWFEPAWSSPGVSWFISADDLRSEARKENRPEEEESTWRPSTSWFEPYSRINPWREPLRQKQVHEGGNKRPSFTHRAEPDLDPRTKVMPTGLERISLQVGLYLSLENITLQAAAEDS